MPNAASPTAELTAMRLNVSWLMVAAPSANPTNAINVIAMATIASAWAAIAGRARVVRPIARAPPSSTSATAVLSATGSGKIDAWLLIADETT